MRNCALATDILQLRDRSNPDVDLLLDNFAGGANLLPVIAEYLSYRKDHPFRDDANQRLVRVVEYSIHGQEISGIIEKGEFGTEEPVINVETSHLDFTKKINEATMFPHYFRFVLPKSGTDGLMILERSGRRGIKGNLQFDLGSYFIQRFDGTSIELSPLLPNQLLKFFMDKGDITKMRFIEYKIPADLYDGLNLDREAQEIETELAIKVKGGSPAARLKQKMQKLIDGGEDVTEFVRVRGVDYEDIKVEFSIDGNRRVISLENPLKRGASWDITNHEDLVPGENGHPTLESLDIIAGQYAQDILKQLRKAGRNV